MDGERGNLTLEFVKLAGRLRPRWVVWENVPGILSIDGGRAFGAFLGGLAELGYGFAYRILDAQHFGVPQRRRRVFVVGYFGDWRPAAAVLFESHCLSGDIAPRREAGKGFTHELAASLTSSGRGVERGGDTETGRTLDCTGADPTRKQGGILVTPLRADGFDASEDGTGRGTPLVPVVIPILEAGARTCKSTDDPRAGMGIGEPGDSMYTLRSGKQHAIGFHSRQDPISAEDVMLPIEAKQGQALMQGMAVRRLTPRECERLQGFEDGYTLITYRGKPAADGPRYKALGNSFAVPVVRWLGERIALVDRLANKEALHANEK
jgi:DNA (cytosine-5)-methyltransferase 1